MGGNYAVGMPQGQYGYINPIDQQVAAMYAPFDAQVNGMNAYMRGTLGYDANDLQRQLSGGGAANDSYYRQPDPRLQAAANEAYYDRRSASRGGGASGGEASGPFERTLGAGFTAATVATLPNTVYALNGWRNGTGFQAGWSHADDVTRALAQRSAYRLGEAALEGDRLASARLWEKASTARAGGNIADATRYAQRASALDVAIGQRAAHLAANPVKPAVAPVATAPVSAPAPGVSMNRALGVTSSAASGTTEAKGVWASIKSGAGSAWTAIKGGVKVAANAIAKVPGGRFVVRAAAAVAGVAGAVASTPALGTALAIAGVAMTIWTVGELVYGLGKWAFGSDDRA